MLRFLALFLRRHLPRQIRRRVSHRVQYVALRGVEGLLLALGLDRASALMGALWRTFAPFNPRHARADRHIAAAMPELDAAARRRLLGDMWENLGRTFAETLLLPRLLAEPERVVCDVPPESLEKARHGAVFVSLHTGNWEIVAVPLVRLAFDVRAVYKPLTNPLVDRYLAERRRSLYAGGLIARDRGVALRLRSLARTGSTLAILSDLRDSTSMDITFFGRPARATPFPALLARRLGLPLFVGRSIRTGGAHFRVDGHWLDVPRGPDAEADAAELTRTIHTVFEGWIRQYPEQWMWAHRKWL
ncbi:lysophospholipid acyltransferase family protein [Siculibacillus lacustris]|uniref:lysophospholipid acyltransferase family protein n=1 Tax=Siculibacillus lacustris TaxID=1549641 RepID=UPI0013F165FA|nr:lauroyl acyltransferase [Siculibacillus lacustris]